MWLYKEWERQEWGHHDMQRSCVGGKPCAPDDHLLKAAKVPVQVSLEAPQVDDGVCNQLAWAMVSGFSPTFCAEQGVGRGRCIKAQMLQGASRPQCVHRRMLDKQQKACYVIMGATS